MPHNSQHPSFSMTLPLMPRGQALVGARQKVVMRAEEARLAREADLKTLENLNAQLAEAEDRQVWWQSFSSTAGVLLLLS